MSNCIEGVDYLMDRYAVLGIAENSSVEVIKRVVKEGRAANHPDRLRGASEAIIKVANDQRNLINVCADILLDPELRAGYDLRLADFRKRWPKCIATDGIAINDLNKPKIDLDDLLENPQGADADLVWLAKVQQMSGHDPAQLAMLERLLAAAPESNDVRETVRSARVTHWIYCGLLEDIAWARAGVRAPTPSLGATVSPFRGVERVQERLTEWSEISLPATLALRHEAAALRLAPPLRLLSHDSSDNHSTTDQALLDIDQLEILNRAKASFKTRSVGVVEAAKVTQEALAKVLELTPLHVLCQGDGPLELILALGSPNDPATRTPVAPFRLDQATITGSSTPSQETVGDWIEQPGEGTKILIGHHTEIHPLLAEIWWFAENAERLGYVTPLTKGGPEAVTDP